MPAGQEAAQLAPPRSEHDRQVIVESHEPTGPFAAKGVGEPSLVPVAPAIANAIYQAVGTRIVDLPITHDKLYKKMRGL